MVPKSTNFLKDVYVGVVCNSVCQDKGLAYVGMDSGDLHIIYTAGDVIKNFKSMHQAILGIRACQDYLFIYIRGVQHTLHRFDLASQQMTSWVHRDTKGFHVYGCRLCIIKDQLFVADVSNQRLTCYKLDGEIVKHIPCKLIPKDTSIMAMCRAGNEAVVVTLCQTSKVFMLILTTGDVEWEKDVSRPQGVTLYGGDLVQVATQDTKLSIFNVRTGENR